jgi:hypothetical protein
VGNAAIRPRATPHASLAGLLPELVLLDLAALVLGEHADRVDLHVLAGLLPLLQRHSRLIGGVLVGEEREHQLLRIPAHVSLRFRGVTASSLVMP